MNKKKYLYIQALLLMVMMLVTTASCKEDKTKIRSNYLVVEYSPSVADLYICHKFYNVTITVTERGVEVSKVLDNGNVTTYVYTSHIKAIEVPNHFWQAAASRLQVPLKNCK